MSTDRSIFWTAQRALTPDHVERMQHWFDTMPVPWLRGQWQGATMTLLDDRGGTLALDLGRARPAGEIASLGSNALWLGVLRSAQLLGLALSNARAEPIPPDDLDQAFAAAPDGLARALFEERAIALGVAPRTFRMRHLALANRGGGAVF